MCQVLLELCGLSHLVLIKGFLLVARREKRPIITYVIITLIVIIVIYARP